MKKITISLNLICALLIAGSFSLAAAGNNAGGQFNVWPDTGQSECYNKDGRITCPDIDDDFFGQDAQYQGHERSYTKLGYDGEELPDEAEEWLMTRDNVTGLIWEIKTSDDDNDDTIHDINRKFTWCDTDVGTNGGDSGVCDDTGETDTESFINNLNDNSFGGFNDWRLPTAKELSTLIHMGQNDANYVPAIDIDYFPHTSRNNYWSATTLILENEHDRAWFTCFSDKCLNDDQRKAKAYRVRAVREGVTPVTVRFVDNKDGTVTDRATNLMWQKCSMGLSYNDENGECTGDIAPYQWQAALESYKEMDHPAGYYDWRLPNRNELQALVDYSRSGPAINSFYFPDIDLDNEYYYSYWTSTTQYDLSDPWFGIYASYVEFNNGVVCRWTKSDQYGGIAVRLVRKALSYDMDIDGDVDGKDLTDFAATITSTEIDETELENMMSKFTRQFGTIL